MPIPFNPQYLFELAQKLNVFQTVKDKLIARPDDAADKLVTVLGELSKIYAACDAEIVRYLSLSFDKEGNYTEERRSLLALEGGQIQMRAGEARGHCHKVWNIYETYLNKWFTKVLSPDEAKEMDALFRSLVYADSQMDLAIYDLTGWLSREATEMLDLVDSDKFDEANSRIKAARREILPTRQAISQAMNDLLRLQGDFIAASAIV